MLHFLKRVTTIAIAISVAAAVLAGCGGKSEAGRRFDGESSINIPFGSETPLRTYTVDIRLQSRRAPDTLLEPSETTPPMPFRLGRLAAHLAPDGYKLWLRAADKTILVNSTVGDPEKFTRITFVGDPETLIIYVNGGEVVRTARPVALSGPIIAGSGYRQRYWDGDIAYFDVYNKMKELGEFAPDAERFDQDGRIASLPADL